MSAMIMTLTDTYLYFTDHTLIDYILRIQNFCMVLVRQSPLYCLLMTEMLLGYDNI